MTVEERRTRDRAARRGLITATARRIAEQEGWDAVTTRRLSTEIEYSQPVIYQHFASMDQIAEAVALEGFGALAEALAAARVGADVEDAVRDGTLERVAHAYGAFAAANPALYDVMFSRATGLRFGPGSQPELAGGFAELRAAVCADAQWPDPDTATEVLWAALHGLITLGEGHRLRPERVEERIDLLVAQFRAGPS